MTAQALDPARLAAVISPLRRALLAATREVGGLPDIPDAQIQVIRALPDGTTRTPSELAAELHLDRSTISNLLAAMQRAKLVERAPDPNDGRRSLVTTSARARELFAAFDRSSTDLLGAALDALDLTDREAIAAAQPALERLLDALLTVRVPGDAPHRS